MSKKLVSVMVPVYNHANYIGPCLESIISQTYTDLEIIVSDNHSTDGTVDVIKEFAQRDNRIKAFYHAENRGFSWNFNFCLDHVNGDLLSVVWSDDILLPEKIALQVAEFEKNDSLDAVLHWVELFDSDSGRSLGTYSTNILENIDGWALRQNFFFQKVHSAFPPSAIMVKPGYYKLSRFDERLPYKNEVLFGIELFAKKPEAQWAVIPKVLSRYRRHETNMSGSSEMKELRLEETLLIHAIVQARYPHLAKRSAKATAFFLYQNLLQRLPQNQELNKYEQLIKLNGGIFIYIWYLLSKVLLKLGLLYKVTSLIRICFVLDEPKNENDKLGYNYKIKNMTKNRVDLEDDI